MSLNSHKLGAADVAGDQMSRPRHFADNPLVLLVKDQEEPLAEMKQVLELNGYRVIDTDNGLDAAKRARYTRPDLVLVDLEVPLIYELVAARQIMKKAFLGTVPFVIVTHEDELNTYSMMEVCVRRNEYVTRLSDYEQLEHLLDYLLPAGPETARAGNHPTEVEGPARTASHTKGTR